jgi:acyl-CoA synthetase (AMP-forming)/AMP-acid ligase II
MRGGLLHHRLEEAATRFGERTAIVAGDDEWTFAALEQRAEACAGFLASKGVAPGGRVALMSSNRPEFVIAVYAISKLGAAAVLLNPVWKSLEVKHALDITDPAHALGDGAAVGLLAEQLGAARVTDLDEANASGTTGSPARPASGRVRFEDEVVMVFSSGTTGMPKAVRHTHASIGAAIGHWRDALGLTAGDRFQVATPPSHILGLLNLVTAISVGAQVRLHRRFDLDEMLARIQDDRMTLEMAVAPIALTMANHPELEKYDLSSLRYIMWGATPVTPAVAEVVTSRTGVRWLPAYGASELPVISVNPVANPASWRLDSAGLPVPGVELRVVDLDGGGPLPSGEVGEIQARSPSLMAGYLPAEANADAFVDGWYRTGDVGWLEAAGWVHLTDRSKEMIKVKGYQVAPAELEAVLHAHPGVVDCAVFGVSDERSGEVPVAAVQLQNGRAVTAEDLVRLVSDSLAPYKRLHRVIVVDQVPRLPSGKVLRRVLRDEWEPRLRAGSANA